MDQLLTKAEVAERVARLNQLVSREYELQERLLTMKIYGTRDHVEEAKKQHDETLQEINRLRHEEMLPLVVELNDFITAAKAKLGRTS